MRVLGNDKKTKDGRLHVSYMKEHFELLDRIAKAIAAQFGLQFETVLVKSVVLVRTLALKYYVEHAREMTS